MHARVVLGVGKGVLFREVSSVQGSGVEPLSIIFYPLGYVWRQLLVYHVSLLWSLWLK